MCVLCMDRSVGSCTGTIATAQHMTSQPLVSMGIQVTFPEESQISHSQCSTTQPSIIPIWKECHLQPDKLGYSTEDHLWKEPICLPPVPSPLVKSPPWIIKSLITLWNLLPLYVSFVPPSSWKWITIIIIHNISIDLAQLKALYK